MSEPDPCPVRLSSLASRGSSGRGEGGEAAATGTRRPSWGDAGSRSGLPAPPGRLGLNSTRPLRLRLVESLLSCSCPVGAHSPPATRDGGTQTLSCPH